ncbi:MAG: extensin family protein [Myxococcota bacterium]|nr:extensin family protein [Myxococcota bacterium]
MSKTSTRLAFKYWCARPLTPALSFLISLSACSEGIDPREGEPTPFEMADGSMRPSAGGANPIPWEMRGGEEPPVGGDELPAGGEAGTGGRPPAAGEAGAGGTPPPMGGEAGAGGSGGSPPVGGGEPLPPDPRVNAGWIGGPCAEDSDCPYEGGFCLTDEDGFPRGLCSQSCERLCPDMDGMPVTFCVGEVALGGGVCVQQCDGVAFPGEGCRPGYSCVGRGRYQESSTQRSVCLPTSSLPDEPPPPPPPAGDCLAALDALGAIYEARGDVADTVNGDPGLQCLVRESVRIQSPIGGVSYRYIEHESASPLFVSCEMALAIFELSEFLQELDIIEVGHIGTYNCRTISGRREVSRHGFGDALDIRSFLTRGGDRYDVYTQWEHDTEDFRTAEAELLWEIGQQMHARGIFNIVLTPNFNAAHDNHYHVDLTPDANFHGKQDGQGFFGPSPHGD